MGSFQFMKNNILIFVLALFFLACPKENEPIFPDGSEHYKILSMTDVRGMARDISVADSIVCVAAGEGGLQIFDISNPEAPRWIGENLEGDFAEIEQVEYSASSNVVYEIIEESGSNDWGRAVLFSDTLRNDTLHTSLEDDFSLNFQNIEMKIWDQPVHSELSDTEFLLFTLRSSGAFRIYRHEKSGADSWNRTGETFDFQSDGIFTGFAMDGNICAVSRSQMGFILFDFSKFDIVNLVGATKICEFDNLQGEAEQIAIRDNLVAVALDEYDGGEDGIALVDITNPELPQLRKIYFVKGRVNGMVFDDEKLFIAAGTGGLVVLDVSDPAVPLYFDGLDFDYVAAVQIYDAKIWIADRIRGLIILKER